MQPLQTRRQFLQIGSLTIASGAIAIGSHQSLTQGTDESSLVTHQLLALTPACGTGGPTPSRTAGPFYTPNSPKRSSLIEPGINGTKLILTGKVLNRTCQPMARALVDVWQADQAGNYDNSGYKLRGHQFTDSQGRYRLETIVPGLYPGRVRHIHVAVQVANQPLLTTQLFFPGEAGNASDGLFNPVLLLRMNSTRTKNQAVFNFVLA
ncbi:hypothetical protein JOY44_06465 [Phormidium sp. CLA17]|uniref:dioxygenase family protein n=1 Tax=Leptolyngbya sp. Cla-17 TaxID=2803751 RepID=UPI001492C236|nr:intradiol ring-cleavage dioxygenase [Leptolyngbya sp. Cla-17]MBM0741264.1 hypothetical protein [Leptolyngbya sp. Cla-17]